MDDVVLKKKIGSTEFPITTNEYGTGAVEVLSRDTTSVTVQLNNKWSLEDNKVDHIFTYYKETLFDKHCYESNNVHEGVYDTITIQCNLMNPRAYLEICVADDIAHKVLSKGDDAEVRKCCHPTFSPETPVVCYSVEISCDSECNIDVDDTTQQRRHLGERRQLLRGGENNE
jgi:hypothetical protein